MDQKLKDDLQRCCRLCAEEQDVTVMIFSAEAEAMLLMNKLNKYLLIEVDEDDKLPKNICLGCCSKLQTVCDFIDTVHKAQDILLNRSLMMETVKTEECIITNIKSEAPENLFDDDTKIMAMEVNVDPMMILQNSDDVVSPNIEENCHLITEDVTYQHNVDPENVSIKLIRINNPLSESTDSKTDADTKPFPCKKCNRGYFTELALKNHMWTHFNEELDNNLYNCSSCKKDFDFKSELIAHLKQHKTSGLCRICGRMFRSEQNLAAHMVGHMAAGKSHTCKICGRSYNSRSNLKTHSITHSNERPYQCHICKKSFKRNQDLKFHINQHTGAKPYKCPFCEKSFASSGNCYSHRSRMHPGKRVESIVRGLTPRENTNNIPAWSPPPKSTFATVKGILKYKCQLCEHSFMKRDNFTYHMYQHTGEKPFQCTLCTEKFVTRRGLQIHHDKGHPTKDRPLSLLSKNALLK